MYLILAGLFPWILDLQVGRQCSHTRIHLVDEQIPAVDALVGLNRSLSSRSARTPSLIYSPDPNHVLL